MWSSDCQANSALLIGDLSASRSSPPHRPRARHPAWPSGFRIGRQAGRATTGGSGSATRAAPRRAPLNPAVAENKPAQTAAVVLMMSNQLAQTINLPSCPENRSGETIGQAQFDGRSLSLGMVMPLPRRRRQFVAAGPSASGRTATSATSTHGVILERFRDKIHRLHPRVRKPREIWQQGDPAVVAENAGQVFAYLEVVRRPPICPPPEPPSGALCRAGRRRTAAAFSRSASGKTIVPSASGQGRGSVFRSALLPPSCTLPIGQATIRVPYYRSASSDAGIVVVVVDRPREPRRRRACRSATSPVLDRCRSGVQPSPPHSQARPSSERKPIGTVHARLAIGAELVCRTSRSVRCIDALSSAQRFTLRRPASWRPFRSIGDVDRPGDPHQLQRSQPRISPSAARHARRLDGAIGARDVKTSLRPHQAPGQIS